MKQAGGDLV